MTIKRRIATLEKAILDKPQDDNHMVDVLSFTPEVRRKILDSCFGGKYEEVKQESSLCKNMEERLVIIRKYAIHSVKEALLMQK
jgi:hypothetical protein